MKRLSAASALTAAAILLAGCGTWPSTAPTPTQSPAATEHPSLSPSPSPSPSAATAEIAPLAEGGTMFPGTYSTRFVPALTLTIGHEVDLDCVPGYRCRGDIDVNLPNWLGLEFGNDHGVEFNVFRMDRVFDPKSPKRLIDPPDDFAAWISSWPSVRLLTVPKAVTIGGRAAVQLDAQSSRNLKWGLTGLTGPDDPHWIGLGRNPTRLILLKIDGHAIMVTEQPGPENTGRDFDAAVDGLQQLVESIVWQ